jgi:hypothetical protein
LGIGSTQASHIASAYNCSSLKRVNVASAGNVSKFLPPDGMNPSLLPGGRKSVEPMAARLAPDNVRRMHQSLHHLVADAPWNDDEMLAQVRRQVLPSMQKHGPMVAWIVDDTGFPKQGKHSVGVARQYCGQIGKHAVPFVDRALPDHRHRSRRMQGGNGWALCARHRPATIS